ncbi:Protein of unknown function [Asanoa hainanensis]|uniref:DUF1116 domain-containing protein n=1 Tax=Asanoa hainanensis TaxID=560556 RepID=A0A239GQE4_9ACTN|nr:DUF1116 domain-containing protein [Asanoa hainanensis]SNS71181.1 Protein of unknown function [Asanoa hainanensis]
MSVVNLGLSGLAEAVAAQGAPVVHVDWRPPAGGDAVAVRALTDLYGLRSLDIDPANAEVLRRLDTGVPVVVDVRRAGDVVPGMTDRTLLHPGPPIAWDDVCDPLRRSMRAAAVAEGWARQVDEAEALLATGRITLAAANDHATVVPMATALGPSMPVWVVDNAAGGVRAFAPVGQGAGDVAWMGRETPAAVERLVFLREVAGPRLARILASIGPVDVLGLAAQGVQMGDDVHMRTQASTNLLLRSLLPAVPALGDDPATQEFCAYLSANHLFFLTVAMAAAKSLTLAAEQVAGATIVTTMARNGTTYGIRLPGSPRWFVAPAPPVEEALFHPGYGPEDGGLDIGDSAVLELVGLGGPATAGSPAVAAFLGGSMADAARVTESMRRICAAESTRFKLPTMDFRGTPLGVDVRRVVETGVTPKVNTGILHAHAGLGQVGAGVATAPPAVFRAALLASAAS